MPLKYWSKVVNSNPPLLVSHLKDVAITQCRRLSHYWQPWAKAKEWGLKKTLEWRDAPFAEFDKLAREQMVKPYEKKT